MRGGDYLSPALVQEIAPDVLRHRIVETYEAEAENVSRDEPLCELETGGDPQLEDEVGFGAFVCVFVEERCAVDLLDAPVPA